jgi:pullulanase/glycogen debranching enzyme
VCAHDGFTLADLVAYNEKHNEVGVKLMHICMIKHGV